MWICKATSLFVCSTGTDTPKNKFVHLALLHTLSFAFSERNVSVEALEKGLDIVIAGDNDFYSQRAKVSRILSARPTHSTIICV
jgi:phosphomevalonate kinase